MIKKCLFTLLWLVPCLLWAQQLSGIIVDTASQPIIFCNIVVLKSDSSFFKGAVSNSAGEFTLFLPPNRYLLSTRHIEYQDVIVPIEVKLEDSLFQKIVLSPQDNTLEALTISERKLGTRVKGDSIFFDLPTYLDGSERNLKNVLEQLPGMTVSESGSIHFGGKKVDRLLVDGDDFFKSQHKIALDNLPANYVEDVELIQNYTTPFSLEQGDQLALNVKTKQQEKVPIIGDIYIGGSPDKRYNGNISLFRLGKQTKINVNHNSNDIGYQSFGIFDYLSFTGVISKAMTEGGSSSSSLKIPKFLVDKNLANKHQQHFSSINFSHKTKNEQFKLEGFSLHSYGKNRGAQTIRQFVEQENIPLFNIQQQTKNQGYLSLSQIQATYKLYDHAQLQAKWMYDYNNGNTIITDTTTIGTIAQQQFLQDRSTDKTKMTVELTYAHELENNAIVKIRGEQRSYKNRDNNKMYSNTPFLNLSTFFNEQHQLAQKVTHQEQRYQVESSYSYPFNQHQWIGNISYTYLQQELTAQSEQAENLAVDNRLLKNYVSGKLTWRYKNKKIHSQLGMQLQHRTLLEQRQVWFLPNVKLKYKLKKSSHVEVVYQQTIKEETIDKFDSFVALSNTTSLTNYRYPIHEVPLTHQAQFNIQHLDIYHDWFFFLRSNITVSNHFGAYINSVNGLNFQRTYLPAQKHRAYQVILSNRKRLTPLDLSVSLVLNNQQTTINSDHQTQRQSYRVNSKVDYKMSKKAKLTTAFSYAYTINDYNDVRQKQHRYTPSINMAYHWSDDLSTSISYHYELTKNEPSVIDIHNLSFDLRYQMKKRPFYFSLEGQNILHLNAFDQLLLNNNNGVIESVTYSTLPGYLLFKIGYKL